MAERKRKTLRQRARAWGERATTLFKYDEDYCPRYIARACVVDGYMAGYRAAQRDAKRKDEARCS